MFSNVRKVLVSAVVLAGCCLVGIGLLYPLVGVAAAAFTVYAVRRKQVYYTAYGTARWCTPSDIPQMLGGSGGVFIGTMEGNVTKAVGIKGLFDSRKPDRQAVHDFFLAFRKGPHLYEVRLDDVVNLAVVSRTGGGKGVSVVVPHLLLNRDSMVILDYKGENAILTAGARRRMGHEVIVLNPFRWLAKNPGDPLYGEAAHSYNPLDFMSRDDPLAPDLCRALAASLVMRTGEEREPHWLDSAESFIAGMVAFVVQFGPPGNRSLQTVRKVLSNPKYMEQAIKELCGSGAWQDILSRMGEALTRYVDRELGSALTTTNRHMNWLDSVALIENTGSSTFDPHDLVKKPMTIYLVVPAEFVGTHAALLRMWISGFMLAVVKNGLQEERLVHFLLDECASLGQMSIVDQAVQKFRAYGIRNIFIFQALGQMEICFPKAQRQTFLSNCTTLFFNVNDAETSKYISDRLGGSTVVVSSGGRGTSRSSQYPSSGQSSVSRSESENDNWAQISRKLLEANEVEQLDPRVAICFTPNCPPMWTRLSRYYEPEFRSGYGRGETARDAMSKSVLVLIAAGIIAALLAVLAGDRGRPASPAPQFRETRFFE